jgi:hypothetical protein
VPGLSATHPDIVFGDFYMAWNQAGLYLAAISMDYYDPQLLAFDGDVPPAEETFRIDWGVDAGAGARRFALYIVPPKVYIESASPRTRAVLCHAERTPCAPVPAAIANYLGGDTPRIVAEVFLPWSALGVNGPPVARQISVELAATAYHRARWMSWSGRPPAQAMEETATWHTVRLGNMQSK